ncbi:hypothetical protein MPER_12790, partial [Moniliophthora perniciosa FA553]
MDAEMKDHFHGPLPPAQFLKKYLGKRPAVDQFKFTKKHKVAFRKVGEASVKVDQVKDKAKKTVLERDMYDKMVTAMKPFCPTVDAINTNNSGDKNIAGHQAAEIRPDITLYKQGTLVDRATDVRLMDGFLEVKPKDVSKDGFDDNAESFAKDTNEAASTRAQMATYAGSIMATQFRTHLFSVWISDKSARLIRWDRGGAIVSQKFDYAEEPYLADFLWRFSFADDQTRGRDPCVELANEQDSKVQKARSLLELPASTSVLKFSVFDEETQTTKTYYGGRLTFKSSISPIGRCTRGLVVVDEAGNLVYLKDTWRIVADDQEKEGETYKILKEAKLNGIPDVLAHGDARGKWRKTVTHKESKRRPSARVHQHYFIVFKQVGRPLWDFKTTLELVKAIRDAVQAHKDALEKAGILHRDISVGNILITDEGGMLIDWDFSRRENVQPQRVAVRTGTWQFMSAQLLLNPPGTVEHSRADDLESFFHVLCMDHAHIWSTHAQGRTSQQYALHVYDRCWDFADGPSGGEGKVALFALGQMEEKAQLKDGPLKDLIVALEEVLAVRYITVLLPTTHPVQTHIDSMEKLKQSDWMVELFDAALAQPDKLTDEPRKRAINTPLARTNKTLL